jgi:uncharacterized protein (TIGR03435 family)
MQRLFWVVLLVASHVVAMRASQAPEFASFDAASIKRNRSSDTRTRFDTSPGRLDAVNVPLRFLIRQSYRVPESRILGGPAWLDSDRFDIMATVPAGATTDTIRGMLRGLLQMRFGLAMHMETREMPVYVLRVARGDGSLGPGLRRSSTDCTGRPAAMAGTRVQCGILVSQGPGSASLRGGSATIESFARLLSDFLERPLNDETGLTGTFDLDLQFTAQRSSSPGAVTPGGLATSPGPDEVPSVFTALQEQLGLKLDAQRGRAEVWVVDTASPPSVD